MLTTIKVVLPVQQIDDAASVTEETADDGALDDLHPSNDLHSNRDLHHIQNGDGYTRDHVERANTPNTNSSNIVQVDIVNSPGRLVNSTPQTASDVIKDNIRRKCMRTGSSYHPPRPRHGRHR